MASSPLRAPAAAGQQQSRLMDMQKKFQQRHLATVAAVKGTVAGSTTSSTTSSTKTTGSDDLPVPPVRRIVGAIAPVQPQPPQRRPVGSGSGGDSIVQVDVKGKQLQRPAARINSKTATVVKKPLATVNGNIGGGVGGGGGVGRIAKKPMVASNDSNRLLLPPVVQPTVINALAAGAGAAAAVASVNASTVAGIQKPLVRAAKVPQKPAATRRVSPLPAKTTPRPPPVVKRATPAKGSSPRPQSLKPQLSADRGPPAKGMARCPLCARDFAADRLPKHEQVCRRTRDRDRKRKVFDTSKKRLEAVAAEAGVDVTSFKKKSQKEDQRVAEKLQKKKDAWRRKHDQLLRNVRAARAVQRHLAAGGTVKDLPPELDNVADQDDEVDSDLVKCPHCGRTFNEASAERHMPLCADRQRNAAARMQNNKKR
ncbi:uncharacterized protein LOC100162021 isoform X2 [Acyrthosiphon pisum]|uniref:C2HC/C3H-type domain-containing protein n=1 Tax=Acyrthosiphon pisum TaxID=7029 RepID=A0A8R2NMD0_ACYPI|nr:uncharacterized protein LOC100162021 isoform X2 [Acyrthosiphon pisum]|eukprot:XP_008180414.1 PREDICTED: uncharacterized protein LOC100162021 isoform X2 [Acyrthosiphon pisum]